MNCYTNSSFVYACVFAIMDTSKFAALPAEGPQLENKLYNAKVNKFFSNERK